jgi:TusE/DsrC/DsvC family sulfur relay protein
MGTETETGRQEEFVPRQEIWNEDLAQRLAQQDGVGELTEEHWRVIRFLREHFIQYGALPPERSACHFSHLDPHCVHRLFHGTKEAWRIAGLPDPGEEAKSYMD